MDFLTLIKNVRDLIAAVQAKDWGKALTAIITILSAFATASPPPIRMAAGSSDHADMVAAVADLESCCTTHNTMATASGDWQSALVNVLLPALLAFLKDWLGV